MAENSNELNLHFLDYWRVVRNRLPIIITIFLLTFISGYVTTMYFLPKVYASLVEIKVSKKNPEIEVFDRGMGGQFDPVFFQSELEFLTSKKMLQPVIKELRLQKVWAQRIFKMQGDAEVPLEDAYNYLKNAGLEVDSKRGSNIIVIKAYSEDPQEAAEIANTLGRMYIEQRKSDEALKYDSGLATLKTKLELQEVVVAKAKAKAEELRRKGEIDVTGMGLGSQQVKDNQLMMKMQLYEQERKDQLNWRTQLDQIKGLPLEKTIAALISFGLADNNLQSLQQQQFGLESEVEKLKNKGFMENHPDVQSMVATLKKVKEQIQNSVDGKIIALKSYELASQKRVEQLEGEVQQLREETRREKTEKIEPFMEAQKQAEREQAELDTYNARYKQISIDTQIDTEPAVITSAASVSRSPVKPNKILNFALSGVVGLVLGVGLAFFIEYLDTSVKTMDDVEKFLGLPVLSVIPQGIRPLNQENNDSPNAEPFRILRAKIDLTPHGSAGQSITVVSGGPGEGKSTTLFNLAYVCAQSGQTVLVVDADLRRPSIHKILGIENERGVADIMIERCEPAEMIQSTVVPNLHVITAGDMPMEQMGTFSANKVRDMLADLKQRYDVVLIDSPPILGISDGSVIAHEVDLSLLVIQHRRYPRDIAARAKRAIDEIRGNLAGVVLNAVAIKSDEAYYYYSSYGDYYSKSGKGKKRGSTAVASHKPAAMRANGQGNGSESF